METKPKNTLKRRNSISTTTIILPTNNGCHFNHHHNSSSPEALDITLDLTSATLNPHKTPFTAKNHNSYTSLHDLLPCSSSTATTTTSSILSPPLSSPSAGLLSLSSPLCNSGYEISIKNRLVKQAAWAYLQPAVNSLSSSPNSSSRRLPCWCLCWCFSGENLRPVIADFKRRFVDALTRGFDWLVDFLWLILCR